MRLDAELRDGIGDDLCARVVHLQGVVVVLVDEELERFEEGEDGLLADLAAASDAVFLRAHVEQRVVDQVFAADEDAGGLRSADVLAAAEGDEVEADCGILPETLLGRNVGGGVVEGVEAVRLGDLDGLGAADLSAAGEDIGEVDGYRLWVDGGDHLFAGHDLDELGAGLADLMVEGVAVALLDDDLILGNVGHIGKCLDAALEVLGHHAGVADDHGRRRAACDESGVAGGRLTKICDELAGRDLELVDQDEVLVALAHQLHDLGLHHRSTDDGDRAIDVDDRRNAERGVDIAWSRDRW